jgi:transcriptional regulator with XRE-family HTH domain
MEKHGTKKKEIAALLNVSRQTIYTKTTDGTFKLHELELLAEFYDVPVEYFNYDGKTIAKEPAAEYLVKNGAIDKVKYENQILREIINNKDKEIERLNREIGRLENKIEKHK